jgi:hypothetical protein
MRNGVSSNGCIYNVHPYKFYSHGIFIFVEPLECAVRSKTRLFVVNLTRSRSDTPVLWSQIEDGCKTGVSYYEYDLQQIIVFVTNG